MNRKLYSINHPSFSGGMFQRYAAKLLGVHHYRLKGRFPCGLFVCFLGVITLWMYFSQPCSGL